MKRVSFEIDDDLVEAAEARAAENNSTLEEVFRRWLEEYADRDSSVARAKATLAALRGKVVIGKHPSRDEMNER